MQEIRCKSLTHQQQTEAISHLLHRSYRTSPPQGTTSDCQSLDELMHDVRVYDAICCISCNSLMHNGFVVKKPNTRTAYTDETLSPSMNHSANRMCLSPTLGTPSWGYRHSPELRLSGISNTKAAHGFCISSAYFPSSSPSSLSCMMRLFNSARASFL